MRANDRQGPDVAERPTRDREKGDEGNSEHQIQQKNRRWGTYHAIPGERYGTTHRRIYEFQPNEL